MHGLFQPFTHQTLESGIGPFPLPPQQASHLSTNIAVQLFKYAFDLGESKIIHPAPKQWLQFFTNFAM